MYLHNKKMTKAHRFTPSNDLEKCKTSSILLSYFGFVVCYIPSYSITMASSVYRCLRGILYDSAAMRQNGVV